MEIMDLFARPTQASIQSVLHDLVFSQLTGAGQITAGMPIPKQGTP